MNMAKMTKAQARKRLQEAITKMEKVRITCLVNDWHNLTANDLNKMWKMEQDIQKMVHKLK